MYPRPVNKYQSFHHEFNGGQAFAPNRLQRLRILHEQSVNMENIFESLAKHVGVKFVDNHDQQTEVNICLNYRLKTQ